MSLAVSWVPLLGWLVIVSLSWFEIEPRLDAVAVFAGLLGVSGVWRIAHELGRVADRIGGGE